MPHPCISSPRDALFWLSQIAVGALCLMLVGAVEVQAKEKTKASLENSRGDLQKTQSELGSSQAKEQELQASLAKTQQELGAISEQATRVAAQIQESETLLTTLEVELQDLMEQRTQKETTLHARGKELSGMVGAMIRLGRAPQEAVLVMPQGIAGKIQASRALGMMSDAMRAQITWLTQEIHELQIIEEKTRAKQQKVQTQTNRLNEKRAQLEKMIEERQGLVAKLQGATQEQRSKTQQLARKSQDLNMLIKQLEEQRAKEEREAAAAAALAAQKAAQAAAKAKKPAPTTTSSYVRPTSDDVDLSKVDASLPAAGRVTGRFGQKRNANDTLRGIQIATRAGAQVTAPAAGTVLFTGPFMEYGKVIIVRHNNRYHTLLAGLGEITCRTGQRVSSGEPIGRMKSSGKAQQLYVELRDGGSPTDPLTWLKSHGNVAKK